ncbi:hypothetical protein [Actinoplanes utahensis]|uniref:hypothetical protein n=1 Tax=Actinoplanes utahensis TaxID=1869 RepID=UPI00069155AB|nr:hypothetical protein [Actinoplanes utahensis]GIF30018.1 hypothetical protein Aut01nite_30040 [Actinoplanes utahensis]
MWVTGGAFQTWAGFLDRWAAGEAADPATLPALDPGHFAGDSWARLTQRITAALDRRLTTWSATLSRELSAARDEFTAAHALHQARRQLAPIRALAAAPALPEELRTRLPALIDSRIHSVQDQLEQHVDRMRRAGMPHRAVEARRRTIRDNPLTAALTSPPAPGPGAGWAIDPAAAPRRRVTLD